MGVEVRGIVVVVVSVTELLHRRIVAPSLGLSVFVSSNIRSLRLEVGGSSL